MAKCLYTVSYQCEKINIGAGALSPFFIFPYTIYMDTQTNQPTAPDKQESKVPEPPALEIDIRTMESDIKAFKEGGGEVPTAGAQETFASQRQDNMQTTVAPAYTGPEKPMFETPATAAPAPQASSGTTKMMMITIGIIVGVIALGLLGYFVLFPLLFKLIQ